MCSAETTTDLGLCRDPLCVSGDSCSPMMKTSGSLLFIPNYLSAVPTANLIHSRSAPSYSGSGRSNTFPLLIA